MKRQGTLVRWEKDRGFGFIRCPEISADVFVHLRDFSERGTAPQVGMRLDFEEIHVGGKGPRAVAVRAARAQQQRPQRRQQQQPQRRSPRSASSSLPMALLLVGYAALLGYGVWTGRIPPIALGVLLLLSLLTFFVYGFDKNAAQAGRWRTAENTLHLLSLAGGWPGAWIAQRLFRHKVSKTNFMAIYWATVLAHMAAVGAWVGKLVPAL
ncbi:DUF1294 domain-containing protein [Variovorax guangxiensis]|uniref:Uncharacterized membrane protein YsdA (DUF1294 family)/cold shock CspA family protein n=1 Tax=Variovorax guangxiensis TaxID=1775474 RepID=A0A840FY80_9BURK|nr:cold shock and DUF1294 domain-containing protein [Variovorax guangxiensis]MBB4222111.1 uncharacterized membrane protein YsdA (DUF1294 family)/cold shock CspA family protein [Variovorax guangxiensis]